MMYACVDRSQYVRVVAVDGDDVALFVADEFHRALDVLVARRREVGAAYRQQRATL